MSDVFIGKPPQGIKNWIIDNIPYWTKFGRWIKKFDTTKLPAVGSYVTVPYKVDPEGDAINTEWQILGYNKSIPSRIRYMNGKDEIFVPTMIGNELSVIGEGTPVYSGKEAVDTIGTLDDVSEEIKVNPGNEIDGVGHTYGNNNPYDAPESVKFNGKEWNFAGYNATIMSKYGLAAKFEGNLYVYSQFDSQVHNDWKTSEIREWLNGTEAVSTQRWYRSSRSSYTTGTITGLLGRLPDQNFMKNIISTVNRTWVHSSWRDGTEDSNGCQHLADKFWLLGEGNVNGNNSYLEDKKYDTSKFTNIFTDDNSRIRKYMNEDGTEGSAYVWWLRSACSDSISGGAVGESGSVGFSYAYYERAVLPLCLIG